ncbi:hypothetical protein CPB84DRAFT_710263 [Gymnopilus junonius]|uniref:Cytochrome b561 domain-containing protein n=1 Tax=Gymnopilus junonius TaxID=109634 RepID=A0A9P5NU62_GYMJU|nr:hypothetical protein CPB84DRAFT_710263 [Gymnopilus junonius]
MHGMGEAGDNGAAAAGTSPTATISFPLSELEIRARNHAILCTIGFLILLPIGALVARYSRTLPYKWFWAHWIIQLVITLPIIGYGWSLGYRTTASLELGHFVDPHEKVGLALLVLYCIQVFGGAIAHFFKLPTLFRGHRPPHSYFHAILGLAIFALAQWQVHYGLFTEWTFATGGLHKVPESAKNAWLALVIVFWVLYALGLALLPRQYKQESQARKARKADPNSTSSFT